MSNLELISELCEIVRRQSNIIDAQAESLEQLGAVVMQQEICEVRTKANQFCL